MSARQHFGDRDTHFDMSAAAAFVTVAIYAYDPAEPPAPALRDYIDKILARATAAGFGQADIFVTLVSKGRFDRAMSLAIEVTAEVGGDAVMVAMIKDFDPKGAAQ